MREVEPVLVQRVFWERRRRFEVQLLGFFAALRVMIVLHAEMQRQPAWKEQKARFPLRVGGPFWR